nr:MAG TPA: hypothetical protein [Caudoviricetes sp.]
MYIARLKALGYQVPHIARYIKLSECSSLARIGRLIAFFIFQ